MAHAGNCASILGRSPGRRPGALFKAQTDWRRIGYHIRPKDGKHPVVLPLGQEVEFKIKNDKMFLKAPDGDRKTRAYQVVAMEPANSDKDAANRSD